MENKPDQSFEELVAEFEASTRPKEETVPDPLDGLLDEPLLEQPITPANPDAIRARSKLEAVYEWAIERERRENEAADVRDLEHAAKHIIEDRGLNVTEKMAKGFLVNELLTDPRFHQAFRQRYGNTLAWNNAIRRAARGLERELTRLPDPELTADRDAIAAAVRGARIVSPAPEESKDVNKMTDKEFNTHLKEQGLGF